MGGRIISILCIIVAIAGIVLLAFGYNDYMAKQNDVTSVYAELSSKLSTLESRKREIQGELLRLEENIEKEADASATLNIIFTDMSEVICTEILPMMQEHEFKGTLAVTKNDLPGNAGKLTDEQVLALADAGWKLIPRWSEGDGATGVEKAAEWLTLCGFDHGGCVMVDSGSLTEEVETALAEAGYTTIVICVSDDSEGIVTAEEIGDLWKPKAIGYLYGERKSALEDAAMTDGHMGFVIGFDEESAIEYYNAKMLSSMLTYLGGYEDNGYIRCMTVDEAKSYRANADLRHKEAVAAAEAQVAEYNAKLAELDEEINKLYKEYK